jgi:digeranylgeranylglycerophospholipid reductase
MSRVVIVGGGPAGCSTAISALKNDPAVNVRIIERHRSAVPRCAGGVSRWLLDKLGLRIPERVIVARIRRVRIHSPNMDFFELKGTEEYGYVLHRGLFDEWLRGRAHDLGATFWWGDESLVKHFRYDYLVGADGATSVVAGWVGASKPPPCDVHLGVQKTVLWRGYPQDLIQLYFGSRVALKGYAWVFPGGEGKARVGLGVPLSEGLNAGRLLDRFIMRVGAHLFDARDFIAKLIPTARPRRSNVFGNVLLVGDAGLMTDPLTGGGICQAVASGEAAGRAIAEGEPESYDRYVGWLRGQNVWRYRLKRVLFSLNDEGFNELVRVMRDFKPKTMSVSRELRRAVRHMALRDPRLLLKTLKP